MTVDVVKRYFSPAAFLGLALFVAPAAPAAAGEVRSEGLRLPAASRIERRGDCPALAAEALRLGPGRPSRRERREVERRIEDLAARVRESLTGGG